MIVSKETERQVVEVLVSAGVKMSFWRLPTELDEERTGPPLQIDDLIDFHFELADSQWFERIQESVRDRRAE